MEKIQRPTEIYDRAVYYFENGYHCAEAVAASVLEFAGEDPKMAVMHATAFGGGIGRSFGDVCGALSGALIAIGHIKPRQGQGRSWDEAALLGAEIRRGFMKLYTTTHCGTLRERFGNDQSKMCAQLTGQVAEGLVDLLRENRMI